MNESDQISWAAILQDAHQRVTSLIPKEELPDDVKNELIAIRSRIEGAIFALMRQTRLHTFIHDKGVVTVQMPKEVL